MVELKLTIRMSDGKTFDIVVPQASTVLELKQACVDGCKLEPRAQRLIFKGMAAHPKQTCNDFRKNSQRRNYAWGV